MARNFIQPGDRLLYANSGSAVIRSGAPLMFGTLLGVSVNDIAPGGEGPIDLTGVWELPCALGADVAAGATLYFDATAGAITDSPTDNPVAGLAAYPAKAADSTVAVRLAG